MNRCEFADQRDTSILPILMSRSCLVRKSLRRNQALPAIWVCNPLIVAPEMLYGTPYTFSVDWWALGVIIYECTYNIVFPKLTQHPFQNEKSFHHHHHIEKAIREQEVTFPVVSQLAPSPFPVQDSPFRDSLVRGLLEKDVSGRIACKQGIQEFMRHPWLQDIDWSIVDARGLRPSYIPDVNNHALKIARKQQLRFLCCSRGTFVRRIPVEKQTG